MTTQNRGKRKTPIRHDVGGYGRKNGTKVRAYKRGSGVRGAKISHRTVTEPKPYTINFKYSDKKGDGESVVVIATGYERALDEAFEEKVDPRHPIEIEMIDPSIGAVLSFIGSGARKVGGFAVKGITKAARIGAKYAIKGGHAAKQTAIKVAKKTAEATKEALSESAKLGVSRLQTKRVHYLLKDCYSSDPIRRQAARWSLKKYYPDVYDVCDFSKE